MASIIVPYLVTRTNKAGVVSHYWQPSAALARAGWRPVAFGKDQRAAVAAAEARNQQVADWYNGGARPSQVKAREQAGTVGALIAAYRRDVLDNDARANGRAPIASTTRKVYATSLKRLEAWAGDQPIAYVTAARVRALRDAMMKPLEAGGIGHHPAHATLKMGRTLFRYAEGRDLIAKGANPFGQFDLAAPAPRSVVWSPLAREAMIVAAVDQAMPSMALAIMLGFAIGQREGDLLSLTRRHYKPVPRHQVQPEDYATLAALAPDGVPRGIEVRQAKTGAWVNVPVVDHVRDLVEHNLARAAAAGATTILLDDTRPTLKVYGGKAGQTRFQRDFAEIREWAVAVAVAEGEDGLAAELAELHFADLRRTCVVYLGELGMDAHLIAGVTGHDIDETQKILKTYMPRTTGRAARAIALASARRPAEDPAKERKA